MMGKIVTKQTVNGVEYEIADKATRTDVSYLKGALTMSNLLENVTVTEGYHWAKEGWETADEDMVVFEDIPVISGGHLLLTGMSVEWFSSDVGGGFKNKDKSEYLGGVTLKNNQIIDVPEDAAWFYMSALKTDKDDVQLISCFDDGLTADDLSKSVTFFDKNDVEFGKYLEDDGTEGTDSYYGLSGYITVEPNSYYIVGAGASYHYGGFYNAGKEFIAPAPVKAANGTYNDPYLILTPPDTKYVRLCFYLSVIDNQRIIYVGSAKKVSMFNQDTITNNYCIGGDGELSADSYYYVSDFIPVEPNTRYLIESPTEQPMWRSDALYDEDREIITTLPSASGLRNGKPYMLTTSKDARFLRLTALKSNVANQAVRCYGVDPDIEKYNAILDQMNRPTYANGEAKTAPLVLLWFTDLHNDFGGLTYISEFYKRFSTKIDDVFSSGDMLETGDYGHIWYGSYSIFDDILQIIGNHELFDHDYNTPYTSKDVYNMQIKDYVDNWNVTQPSNADVYGLNYWYKEYTTQNVMLIGLDCMFWTADELSWLNDALDRAKIYGRHVIIASHYMPGFVDPFDTTHSTKMIVNPQYPGGYGETLDASAAAAVQDFIDAGGNFVCWLSGHTHYDLMGTLHDYPDQVSITLTTAMSRVQTWNDAARTEIANQQSFDLLGIDTYRKVIKIARVGCQYDIYLRHKGTVAVDYNAKSLF